MHQLEQLLAIHGVSSNYWNYKGEYVDVPFENRTGLLQALYFGKSIDFTDDAATKDILNEHALKSYSSPLPPLSIVQQHCVYLDISVELENIYTNLQIQIFDNKQVSVHSSHINPSALNEVEKSTVLGRSFSRRRLKLEELPVGYYTIKINEQFTSQIAVCPEICFTPDWISKDQKQTGVIIQLYSLRSRFNFGIGDFGDLRYLLNKLAEQGISSIGLNPLHALLPNLNENYSPYSPSDRRFINFLYISIKDCPEYEQALKLFSASELDVIDGQIQALREDELIDYAKVKAIKFQFVKRMYLALVSSTNNAQRYKAFQSYIINNNNDLKHYCLLDALSHNKDHMLACEEFKSALLNDSLYFDLANQHADLINIYLYAQWLASDQFNSIQNLAIQKGMNIGLVNDLAVGADKLGSEVLTNSALFCADAAVGAPPDEIAPIGQNWGLPPIDPLMLEKSGYKHFINLLRANMSHCGALRIDHVMGLTRLWWCPPGATADFGAYVHYPFEQILNLLKLESHLNQCAIIGEDLGIVPENFRETLRAANVLSNKVLYFEREGHATFKHPANYERFALAMINNHDVPTLASWWNGDDIALRDELNAIEVGKTASELRQVRREEKTNLVSHLVYGDYYPETWRHKSLDSPADQDLVYAIILWASQANSILFVLQLEDLLLMTKPVNVPGTFREYPNWKRKLTHNLEDMFERPEINNLLAMIKTKRRSS